MHDSPKKPRDMLPANLRGRRIRRIAAVHTQGNKLQLLELDDGSLLACNVHESAGTELPDGRTVLALQFVERIRFVAMDVPCSACVGEGTVAGTPGLCKACSGSGMVKPEAPSPLALNRKLTGPDGRALS